MIGTNGDLNFSVKLNGPSDKRSKVSKAQ